MSSPNLYRFRQKAPQSKFLLAMFFFTLVLVVVNQVFLNLQARQQQAYAEQISGLRAMSLQLAQHAEAAASGDAAALEALTRVREDVEVALSLLGEEQESAIETGLGVTLPLPPLVGYALLLVLLLTIGGYGQQVIRRSREAEQFTAEKNQRNSEAVSKLIGEISSLADGDLTVEATIEEEFTGSIADSINYAVGQLRGLVSAITDVTLQVTNSTDSSTQRVQALSDASRRQSESIDSVYVSIREIGKDINLVSDNAQKSLKVAENSVVTAAGGADVVKDTIKGMDGIREQIQDTSRRIKRLGESSQAIGSFVSLINDIAAHTNTWSLNAAI